LTIALTAALSASVAAALSVTLTSALSVTSESAASFTVSAAAFEVAPVISVVARTVITPFPALFGNLTLSCAGFTFEDFAFVNPNFYADFTESGISFPKTIFNIST
jgi:hypothetical protein